MKDKDIIEQGFLKAYDELADAIFRHCYFRVSDREKAKDIAQETFTKTWEYIGKNGVVDNMRAFLYKVANNLIIDSYRKKKEDSLDEMQEDGFDVGNDDHEAIMNMIAGKEIIRLLDLLDGKYRDVIVMRYIDDMTVKDIAATFSETENVISVRLHRGLKKVREILLKSEFTNES